MQRAWCWGDRAKTHLKYTWQRQRRRSGGFTVPYSISIIFNSCHHESQGPTPWINPTSLWGELWKDKTPPQTDKSTRCPADCTREKQQNLTFCHFTKEMLVLQGESCVFRCDVWSGVVGVINSTMQEGKQTEDWREMSSAADVKFHSQHNAIVFNYYFPRSVSTMPARKNTKLCRLNVMQLSQMCVCPCSGEPYQPRVSAASLPGCLFVGPARDDCSLITIYVQKPCDNNKLAVLAVNWPTKWHQFVVLREFWWLQCQVAEEIKCSAQQTRGGK